MRSSGSAHRERDGIRRDRPVGHSSSDGDTKRTSHVAAGIITCARLGPGTGIQERYTECKDRLRDAESNGAPDVDACRRVSSTLTAVQTGGPRRSGCHHASRSSRMRAMRLTDDSYRRRRPVRRSRSADRDLLPTVQDRVWPRCGTQRGAAGSGAASCIPEWRTERRRPRLGAVAGQGSASASADALTRCNRFSPAIAVSGRIRVFDSAEPRLTRSARTAITTNAPWAVIYARAG